MGAGGKGWPAPPRTAYPLWLQLWDVRTGHILWESSEDIATASNVLRVDRLVPIDMVAQRVWRRMIQDNLLEGRTSSRVTLTE